MNKKLDIVISIVFGLSFLGVLYVTFIVPLFLPNTTLSPAFNYFMPVFALSAIAGFIKLAKDRKAQRRVILMWGECNENGLGIQTKQGVDRTGKAYFLCRSLKRGRFNLSQFKRKIRQHE